MLVNIESIIKTICERKCYSSKQIIFVSFINKRPLKRTVRTFVLIRSMAYGFMSYLVAVTKKITSIA